VYSGIGDKLAEKLIESATKLKDKLASEAVAAGPEQPETPGEGDIVVEESLNGHAEEPK
jgi:hypothetical protein